MGKMMPAANVIFGFIGGIISYAAIYIAKHYGYDTPPDIASALPGANALLLAHIWDVWTGDNKNCLMQEPAGNDIGKQPKN